MTGDYRDYAYYPIWQWVPPFQTLPMWQQPFYPLYPLRYVPTPLPLTPEEIAEVRKLIEKKNEPA